jgi:hypothetical protein
MFLASVGVVLNVLAALVLLANPLVGGTAGEIVSALACGFAGLSVLGLVLGFAGSRKIGGILVIIGGVLFIPLGLVAVIGGKKMMNPVDEDLEARRQLGSSQEPPPNPGAP